MQMLFYYLFFSSQLVIIIIKINVERKFYMNRWKINENSISVYFYENK